MRKGAIILAAILGLGLHMAVILFGGLLFNKEKGGQTVVEKIDIAPLDEAKPDKVEEEKPKEEEKIEETDEVPEFKNLALSDSPSAPALAPMSLSDLESALSGVGGESSFGGAGGITSGGVIGGTGSGMLGEGSDPAMGGGQLDQKPKLVFKVDPSPSAAAKKTLGTVTITVFIDNSGRVSKASVSPQVDPGSEKVILEAVRKWKYEPGMRDGKKVSSKASHRISFST